MHFPRSTTSLFLPVAFVLLGSISTTQAQQTPCVDACLNTHRVPASTTCNRNVTERDFNTCVCNVLTGQTDLVACINNCNVTEIDQYADNVPDRCERTLFPALPEDDDGDNDEDDTEIGDNDDPFPWSVQTQTQTQTVTESTTVTGTVTNTATTTVTTKTETATTTNATTTETETVTRTSVSTSTTGDGSGAYASYQASGAGGLMALVLMIAQLL
ncbi:hypothetical protein BDZ91DRAFT_722192 [Kalaharituber pfeilii]|nr:hypothetical protein BDZ91DRAFT_722192 [Kalaharituber pfeilii]